MSSTSLEHQHLELLPSDLLRPLGAFEELYCLFDQDFPKARCTAMPLPRQSSPGPTRGFRSKTDPCLPLAPAASV
jgi:hypothetical protein